MQLSMTYRTLDDGAYTPQYALPGDECWRSIRDRKGKLLRFETASEAEAAAGHRLVFEMRKIIAA